ncbi:hypothetical protein OFC55_41665, partial [Escherichia coli]|nr:hypothetical protein [Escherichia coli]
CRTGSSGHPARPPPPKMPAEPDRADTLPVHRRHVADARARQAGIFGGASSCRGEGWRHAAAIPLTPIRRVH